MNPVDVDLALTALARNHSGRVLAILAQRFNNVDVADDAVQDALVEAAATWPERGIPMSPPAWLMTVARRKALDRLRSRGRMARRAREHARTISGEAEPMSSPSIDEGGAFTMTEPSDEHLRLILLCCHPALDRAAQIALTLRLAGGLSTPEIAAAFVVSEATLAQRIVRAKQKIRDARIPLSLPSDIRQRLDLVLTVLLLIFNEGYLSRGASDGVLRVDLADESIRLARMVVGLAPERGEPLGLLALLLFQRSRFATRTDHSGDLVLLDDQDRTLWDGDMIHEGNAMLSAALRLRDPGPHQVQAIVASYHANARTAADTDWAAIATAYGHLLAMTPTPVVELNRAVAVAKADGPMAGLRLLDPLHDRLSTYHLFHAARGELLLGAGKREDARVSFERARSLAENPAEKRHLDRRIASC